MQLHDASEKNKLVITYEYCNETVIEPVKINLVTTGFERAGVCERQPADPQPGCIDLQ